MTPTPFFGFDFETFKRLVDNLHDGIIICDNNYNTLYTNKACERQYGLTQEEFLAIPFWDFIKMHRTWNNPFLPAVYEYQIPMQQKQRSSLGLDMLTIGIPIFDDTGALEYVVLNIRDNSHKDIFPDLYELDAKHLSFKVTIDDIVCYSDVMKNVISMANKVANVTAPCLLLGETGCGKSFFAKYIHENSTRKDKNLVVINCAAIPEHLFESELFGHVKGAFSGAVRTRKGLFAKAHKGTLFLDEISEMPFHLQAKLLHAVEEQSFNPVGTSRPSHYDVRILAASNRDLPQMVKDGTFRQDLFYRLNVFEMLIPPLREHTSDIIPIFHFFMNRYGKKYQRNLKLSPEAQDKLKHYPWPGNVRELIHLVERLLATVEGDTILPHHLSFSSNHTTSLSDCHTPSRNVFLDTQLTLLEKQLICASYAKHGSSRKIAHHLGISQSRATRLVRKYITKVSR